MPLKFLKTTFSILKVAFSLIVLGIVIIIVEQFVGYGKHGSYGAVPVMLGVLLIFVSGYSFVKAIIVKIALSFLPKGIKEMLKPKEEKVPPSADIFRNERQHADNRYKEESIDNLEEDFNKSAKSVVTRNR